MITYGMLTPINKAIKCKDCESDNLHWLVWVDNNKKYVEDAHQSQNGEYWCENCREHK